MKQFLNITVVLVLTFFISACNFKATEDPQSSDGESTPAADFIIQNDHLITIESNSIKLYSLTDPANPQLEQTYNLAGDVVLESLYAYKTNMLMIGTTQGSFFKDHSTAGELEDITFSESFTSCDNVITQGNYLYVTLSNDARCNNTNNTTGAGQLRVYSILQITEPELVETITLDEPSGLGISGTNLFVCYSQGVKQFDISVPTNTNPIGDFLQPCNHINANENPMLLTDEQGIRLVEYGDPGLTDLSAIRTGE